MYIIMGRGGVFSVLLGLGIYAVIWAGKVLLYALAFSALLILLAGKGIRAVYRHYHGREPRIPVGQWPRPSMSAINRRLNSWK